MAENRLPGRPLPETRELMLAARKRPLQSNLFDEVERAHVALFDPTDPENLYPRYIDAVWPEASMEGWLVLDDAKAASMMKEHAVANELFLIQRANTATLIKALRVVLRRYGLDRKSRTPLSNGEIEHRPAEAE